jgi:hypothetical protein
MLPPMTRMMATAARPSPLRRNAALSSPVVLSPAPSPYRLDDDDDDDDDDDA